MKPPIFAQLHADLVVIALAAMVIQAVVFIAIAVLHVPQISFATPDFRYGVIGIVAAVVLAVRWIARRAALDSRRTGSR